MPGQFGVAVEAIIEKEGKILLTKRAPDRGHAPNEWETLTGRIEQNESLEEALHREVMEEVGLEVDVVIPFYTFHFYRGKDKVEHQGVSFWCKYKGGEIVLAEAVDYKWVTPDEALDMLKDEGVIFSIKKFKEVYSRQ